LRIREDTAKYLLNLDVNSAHYDPKTRSMREDPLPDSDPNEKFYEVSVLKLLKLPFIIAFSKLIKAYSMSLFLHIC